MSTISNHEFAAHVLKMAKNQPPFQPTASYDPDGDCIEFLASPDPFYAERIDDLVTVYYSQEDNQIIGSLIKGVSEFCRKFSEKMPGFAIEVQDGLVKLEHIFLAGLWVSNPTPSKITVIVYRKLIAMAEENNAETEMSCT